MKTHKAHHGVINCFVDLAKRMGKDITLIAEEEFSKFEKEEERNKLLDNVDLVVSMGTDHTFL